MPSPGECAFCARVVAGVTIAGSALAVAFADAFPVSRGHTLVVPRRHVAGYFDLDADEQAALWQLVSEVQRTLEREHHPDGYNLGVNTGAAAGQTVDHVHVHVIPRFRGDVADPRGGVRWVLGARARYWDEER